MVRNASHPKCRRDICQSRTEHISGFCSSCRQRSPQLAICCLCDGFQGRAGSRTFCNLHVQPLGVRHSVTAHLLARLQIERTQAIIMRLEATPNLSNTVTATAMMIRPTDPDVDEFRQVFERMNDAILKFDLALDQLLSRRLEPPPAYISAVEEPAPNSPIQITEPIVSEEPLWKTWSSRLMCAWIDSGI